MMKAKYIGIDGIVGYEKDRVYKLVENLKNRVSMGYTYKIIQRTTGGGVNVYSSKRMFEKDWEILEENDK